MFKSHSEINLTAGESDNSNEMKMWSRANIKTSQDRYAPIRLLVESEDIASKKRAKRSTHAILEAFIPGSKPMQHDTKGRQGSMN